MLVLTWLMKNMATYLGKYTKPYRFTHRIVDASNNTVQPLGYLPPYFRVGVLCTRTHFLVVSNMSAEVINGIAFIDRFLKASIPQTRRVILNNAPSAMIL